MQSWAKNMVPITLLRKPKTFAEILTKNLGYLGKKGDTF